MSFPSPAAQAAEKLTAGGASFPEPIYGRWFKEYNRATGVQVDYQSVGSGQGIKMFTAGTVDFGASDAAMSDEEMAKVEGGVFLLPMTAGSIVLTFNLPGVTDLKLPAEVYPKIFLGEITKWNDPALVAANPDAKLPDLKITPVFRADSSGTTYNFTNHMSAISPAFKEKIGGGKKVNWQGVGVGGTKNAGVAALVKQTPGAIGYVEYGYANQLKLPMASLQNRAGKFIAPTPESGAAALANVKLPENLRAFDFNPEGDASYPIVTFTWWLVHPKYDDPATGAAIKKLADWCLTDGQAIATQIGYIPLPEPVIKKVKAKADQIQ
ncbi:MAG: phosphate ABC transporter substrate-binding protein PstS [Verrucomicrobiota bacterium]